MESFTICFVLNRRESTPVEFKIPVASTATVHELLLKALEHTNLYKKEDQSYGLSITRDATQPIALKTMINSIPTKKLFLVQVMFKISVYIMSQKKEVEFGLSPLMTVTEAVLFIEQSDFLPAEYDVFSKNIHKQTPAHELLLLTASDANSRTARGIPLEYHRTLRSYRITQADTLVITSAQTHSKIWSEIAEESSEGEKQIPVIVSSQEFACSKAFKISITATFQDVVSMFLNKTNLVVLHRFYTLCLDMAGKEGEIMNLEDELGSFPLPTPARFMCIPKMRPPQVVFGVDPATLPLVNDMGVDVPEILVVLRDMLFLLDPLEQEGLFRKAGNENEMKKMIKLLNEGQPVYSDEIHSVATLIKRWFKDLPKRIFSHLHKSILDDEERLKNIYEELSPMEASLAKWLFELLVDISKHSDVNKMTPNNLGIVFGPGVFGSSGGFDAGSKMAAIAMLTSDSKTGQEIIEKCVARLLEHPEERPLKPEKVVQSIVHNSYEQAEPDGPRMGMPMPRQPILIDFSGDSKIAQILARRRQLAEGEVSAEATPIMPLPIARKEPPPLASKPPPRFAGNQTKSVDCVARNKTQPRAAEPQSTNLNGGRVKSMMIPSGGLDIHSELKNKLSGGRMGLRKIGDRQQPQTPAPDSPNTSFRKSLIVQTKESKSASTAVMNRFLVERVAKEKEATKPAISPPKPRPPIPSSNPKPPQSLRRTAPGSIGSIIPQSEAPVTTHKPPANPTVKRASVPVVSTVSKYPARTPPSRPPRTPPKVPPKVPPKAPPKPQDLSETKEEDILAERITAPKIQRTTSARAPQLKLLSTPEPVRKVDSTTGEILDDITNDDIMREEPPQAPKSGQILSPRSKLDLLLAAAEDFSEESEEQTRETKQEQEELSPKQSISFEDDDDSDPIQELLDFVESESTPLEKLLGLESPTRSEPPKPKPPVEPRVQRTQTAPAINISGPPSAPPPMPPQAQTPSRDLSGSRKSILFRKKKEVKKEDEESTKKKTKRFSRFHSNKKDKDSKMEKESLTGALAQPGLTWGKSKDAEEILAKLRNEGLV